MATLTFDTHNFIERLIQANMDKKQAEAIVEGLKEADLGNVATKEDILKLETKIEAVQKDMLKWLVPLLIGQAALTATFVKLFALL